MNTSNEGVAVSQQSKVLSCHFGREKWEQW